MSIHVCFGAYTLDARQRRLDRDGTPVELAPKQFDALLLLVEHAGDLISKETFHARLWPDTVVSETSLNKYIWQLRRILGESEDTAIYIETVPKLGYRFVAEVHAIAARGSQAGARVTFTEDDAANDPAGVPAATATGIDTVSTGPAAPSHPVRRRSQAAALLLLVLAVAGLAWLRPATPPPRFATPITTIAVLPFKPLLPSDRDPVAEMGIADSLIAKLSSSHRLVVRSISAVRRYDALEQDPVAAGQQLGVGAVLEGQLQKRGDRLHVSARLLAVPGGAALWSGTYDTGQSDVFAMQDAIAEHVAVALALQLNGNERRSMTAEPTRDPQAYRLYLSGRYHINKARPDDIRIGIDYLRKAIERDPSYALAYAGIAEGYERLPITGDVAPREAFPLAKAAALKALQIDDTIAEAHNVLGWVAFWYDWDWANADAEFRRSIALNPNIAEAHQGYSHLHWLQGHMQAARSEGRRARELDPLSPLINTITSGFEEPEERERILARVFSLDPDFWILHLSLGGRALHARRYDEAIAEFGKARDLSGGNLHAVSALGEALVRAGRIDEAKALISSLETRARSGYIPGTSIAQIYLALGDREQAIAWLQRAYAERDVELSFIKVRSYWDPLRADPRFVAIVAGVGLG
jgi:DNA-binding winged helix-turn-helix (wHTH) protein/TolB-like protein/tetratricopeptide (TPR) repeat protein